MENAFTHRSYFVQVDGGYHWYILSSLYSFMPDLGSNLSVLISSLLVAFHLPHSNHIQFYPTIYHSSHRSAQNRYINTRNSKPIPLFQHTKSNDLFRLAAISRSVTVYVRLENPLRRANALICAIDQSDHWICSVCLKYDCITDVAPVA